MDSNTAIDAGNVCQNCALCCSGSLFSYVTVYKEEEKNAKEIGLEITNRADKRVFNLPCTRLSNNRCSVYANRPQKCSGYHCDLARSVIKGKTTYKDANEAVISAKEQMKWLFANATYATEEALLKLNLRDYLEFFLKRMKKKLSNNEISEADESYALKAFEFLKHIGNNFKGTSLLTKYSMLIQSIHYAKTP